MLFRSLVRFAETQKRTSFILYMLLQVAKRFLQYLKQIDKIYNYMERQLYKSQRNKELIQLLDLEKSLVYFNTSLKANEVTLEKILRGRIITLYEEDHDLLEDVLIEVRQAIEMANIYSSIISGMMDAFASVISNNLNVIMKVLTSITILLTIPNIFFSFYGMNVANLPLDHGISSEETVDHVHRFLNQTLCVDSYSGNNYMLYWIILERCTFHKGVLRYARQSGRMEVFYGEQSKLLRYHP